VKLKEYVTIASMVEAPVVLHPCHSFYSGSGDKPRDESHLFQTPDGRWLSRDEAVGLYGNNFAVSESDAICPACEDKARKEVANFKSSKK
jgi:hypothetical protein